jgi:hypothetical protein
MKTPDPYSLSHQPVFLLPYDEHDGPFAGATDCKYLSVGWAQYEPPPGQSRGISVKTLRHTGTKFSRQSEEIPIHRAIDLVLLLANAVRSVDGNIDLPSGRLENQRSAIRIEAKLADAAQRRVFKEKIRDRAVLRRLGVLLDTLQVMRSEKLI